jgi:hypothetical protein
MLGMVFCMTIATQQYALVQFLTKPLPRPTTLLLELHILCVEVRVVEVQRIRTLIVPALGALTSKVLYSLALVLLPSRNGIAIVTLRAHKLLATIKLGWVCFSTMTTFHKWTERELNSSRIPCKGFLYPGTRPKNDDGEIRTHTT